MVRLVGAPAVLPTIAMADPGEGPGGPALPPPIISRSGYGTVLGGSMETPKAEPMVPPVSCDFGKRPELFFCYFFVADH